MKKDEKDLKFDDFKEAVYTKIGLLESLDENNVKERMKITKKGCFGIFILPIFNPFLLKMTKKASAELKIKELSVQADEIISRPNVKKSLCAKLKDNDVLPIEVAYKITPVLYKMAQKDEIPTDSILFAIIARKIAEQGAAFYCVRDE